MAPSDNFSDLSGLSEQEANEQLAKEGGNELSPPKERHFLRTLLGVITEPMFLLLIICGVVYLVIGDPTEAIVLFSFVLFVILNTLYQERKTEHALAALKELSSPRAKVIREGKKQQIDSRLIVTNDLVYLAEGDRVPADGILVSCTNLLIDESLLTGESVPVRKTSSPVRIPLGSPGGDDLPYIYSSTLVVGGKGLARVSATGTKTQVGHIGTALAAVKIEKTSLQKESRKVVRIFAGIGIGLCIVVFLSYGLLRHIWLKGLLASLALAMSVLPEEIPMIFSIFMALGAFRMSKKHVLTRRIQSIEVLGAATVLCVDKTGTLTFNKMSIEKILVNSQEYSRQDFQQTSFPQAGRELIRYGILASQRDPFDPMEIALHELGTSLSIEPQDIKKWNLIREYPLTPQLFSMAHAFQILDSPDVLIAAKGAPEAIAKLCQISPEQQQIFHQNTEKFAEEGLRVIAMAYATLKKADLPERQDEIRFSFLGFVAFSDPVRPQAQSTVTVCRDAGIRVLMMTGDHPRTALSIGKQIGLPVEEGYLTGAEIDTMEDQTLREKSKRVSIYARVSPQHKLRLVNLLKANGEVVAMTGDGVNDAPALKAANIGIAMGGRGTDVAREAAALILLDDNISSWTDAIHLGRRIYDNIGKAMAYAVAIHVPLAGLAVMPVLLKWPLILLPVHIASLQMVIDPACSLVFEADQADPDIMKRPPRDPHTPLFHRRMLIFSTFQGFGLLLFSLLGFGFATWQNQSEAVVRTMTFFIIILGNLGLILTNRSWQSGIWATLRKPNVAFWIIIIAVFVLGGLVLGFTPLRNLYSFAPLSKVQLGLCFLGGFCNLGWSVLMKWVFRKKLRKTTFRRHSHCEDSLCLR